MRYRKSAGEALSVHIHTSDYDHESVCAMDDIIAQLCVLIATEKLRCGTPNMITYHLERAVEYAKRERDNAEKRIRLDED